MTLRPAYLLLLHLHPATFRERFGDEMLECFDHAHGLDAPARLLADAAISLIRQWTLRPEFRRPMPEPIGPPSSLFQTPEPSSPLPSVFLHGALLTIATFCGLISAISHSGKAPEFFAGSKAAPNTSIQPRPESADPRRETAAIYFKLVRVLSALDADRDFIISEAEMRIAFDALRGLDINHDGKLSADECGFFIDPTSRVSPDTRERLEFMRNNPVLAVLDADGDGEISQLEMINSPAALHRLDRNGNGALTAGELMPGKVFAPQR